METDRLGYTHIVTNVQAFCSLLQGVELTTHYLILVDSKYTASGTPYHYVPQEDIELGPHQQVDPSKINAVIYGVVPF